MPRGVWIDDTAVQCGCLLLQYEVASHSYANLHAYLMKLPLLHWVYLYSQVFEVSDWLSISSSTQRLHDCMCYWFFFSKNCWIFCYYVINLLYDVSEVIIPLNNFYWWSRHNYCSKTVWSFADNLLMQSLICCNYACCLWLRLYKSWSILMKSSIVCVHNYHANSRITCIQDFIES